MKKISKYVLTASLLLNQVSPLMVAAEELGQAQKYQDYGNFSDFDESQLTVSGTDHDIENPVIDLESFSLSKTEATLGDTVTYTVKVSDNEAVSNVSISLVSDEGYLSENVYFDYNEKSDQYEGKLEISNQMGSGTWRVKVIYAYDNVGNNSRVYDDSYDFSAYNLLVTGTNPDFEAPVTDLASLTISQKEAGDGEKIKFSMGITDNVGIDYGFIYFYHPESDTTRSEILEYNRLTKQFDAYFQVREYIQSGEWVIQRIQVRDDVLNEQTIFNANLETDRYYTDFYDFSEFNFTVSERDSSNDTENPEINLGSLAVSAKEATLDEVVTYSVEALDNEGISYGYLTLINLESGQEDWFEIHFDAETSRLKGDFEIDYRTASGVWKIDHLTVFDTSNNFTEIFNSSIVGNEERGETADLDAADVTVSGTNPDFTPPSIELNTLSISQTEATAGDLVLYTVVVTDDRAVQSVGVQVYNLENSETDYFRLHYNQDTGKHEGLFQIDQQTYSGTWQIESVYAYDEFGNKQEFYNEHSKYYREHMVDLSAYDLLVTGTDPDHDGPTINPESLSVTKGAAALGDTVKFSLEVTDKSEIEEVTLILSNNDVYGYVSVEMQYNEESHLFEAEVTVDNQMLSGQWIVNRIYARDSLYNSSDIYNVNIDGYEYWSDAYDLSAGNLLVSGTSPDFDGPLINAGSLTSSKQEATVGDVVTFSVELYDATEITNAYFSLHNEEMNVRERVKLAHNKENGLYEGSLVIDESTYSGLWEVNHIYAEDPFENMTFLTKDYFDMSKLNLTITGTQSNIRPEIHLDTLKVSHKKAALGDTIAYSFDATGFREPVEVILMIDNRSVGRVEYIEMNLNPVTNRFEGTFTPEEAEWDLGRWIISTIHLYEDGGTTRRIYNKEVFNDRYDNEMDLSAFDLIVSEEAENKTITASYSTHIQNVGWQEDKKDGETSGSVGAALRLEGIKINLEDLPFEGNVTYQTHVESYGWMDWKQNGEMSGTENEGKRLEAIRIKLSGELAEAYDIYYRVHAETYGWLDWAKNGAEAGTAGLGKRLEAIEIQVIKKGEDAPGKVAQPYVISNPVVSYTTHVEKEGWQDYVKDGALSGTEGKGLRLESIKLDASDPAFTGGIEYRTHIQNIGWQAWKANNQLSGTEGQALRLEAIQIKLNGQLADAYDVYYRVHAESYGWLDWAKNGAEAGTAGFGKRLEAIEVQLVPKGAPAPGATINPYIVTDPVVSYTTHVQNVGWQEYVADGAMSGTEGQGLRLEALKINVSNQAYAGGIEYRTHIQNIGWQDWKTNDQLSGTEGQALRLEAMVIRLTGELAEHYDVYYRVHAESYGWLGWAKNGESAGTENLAKRLEGMEVMLVPKGGEAPGSTEKAFVNN